LPPGVAVVADRVMSSLVLGSLLLHCVLAAAQYIVIGPVYVFLAVFMCL